MSNDTMIVVMAHKDAQDTFDRHMPYWESHGYKIMVWCPRDSVVTTCHEINMYGTASHHDAEANRRFKALFRLCLDKPSYNRFAIFEYDAICFRDKLPFSDDKMAVRGPWFHDPTKTCGGTGWRGHWFCHPPLLLHRDGMQVISKMMDSFPDDVDGGCWDRMFGSAVEEAGLVMENLRHHIAYTANTLHYGYFDEAIVAARRGAYVFHGIKDAVQLNSLRAAMIGLM